MGLTANSTIAVALLLLLSLLLTPPPVSAKLTTTTFQYDNFSDSFQLGQTLQADGQATISNFALQITLDTANSAFSSLNNLSGRILYKTPFKLWEGWCHKHGKLLLVYGYMPNLSLDRHLFSNGNSKPLRWDLRLKIISGVASALHYLHNEYDQRVVHRDLKPSNIMLDSEFNARLGDFGLARALDNESTSYAEAEGVLGTLGYIAPECFHTCEATQQSDMYAFGAVLLEVVCGEKAKSRIGGYQFLVDWVWAMHREGRLLEAVDKRLGEDYVVEEAQRILLLGLACSHPIASERPRTQEISQMVSGSVAVPEVPQFKPAFVWPSLPMGEEGISMATTTTTSYPTSQYGSGWTPLAVGQESQRPYSDSFNTV
ncbi:hypothetical protein Vadar_033256 [Vaccinium darrowii]|uniref:Uncharacterized protein n=1 Tax=Vaccinium darrowii TaxID=229202 RepID=A0ACB7YAM5_9ERIC|nr:hypothetical protein Vadar_033256 [Vaccinium darrowii]